MDNEDAGGVKVAVRARRVHGGEELQRGPDEAEHGHLRLGAQRPRQGDDRRRAAAASLPWKLLRLAGRPVQVPPRPLGRRDLTTATTRSRSAVRGRNRRVWFWICEETADDAVMSLAH